MAEGIDVVKRLAKRVSDWDQRTSGPESSLNPLESDRQALEKFMEHLALKEGVDVNDIRYYRDKALRRGIYQVTETAWDVGKFLAGGVGAQWLYQLVGMTSAGIKAAGGLQVPKIAQTVSFLTPIFFLRRYAKLVNENRKTLDAARVADRVWSDPNARSRLLGAIRDNNSGEYDALQREYDRHPVTKHIRKWLPRALALTSGVGLGAVGYQGLVSFLTILYADPSKIPGALAQLPLTGLEEIRKIGTEGASQLKDGALTVWDYVLKKLQ